MIYAGQLSEAIQSLPVAVGMAATTAPLGSAMTVHPENRNWPRMNADRIEPAPFTSFAQGELSVQATRSSFYPRVSAQSAAELPFVQVRLIAAEAFFLRRSVHIR